jgi:hypothetical protein
VAQALLIAGAAEFRHVRNLRLAPPGYHSASRRRTISSTTWPKGRKLVHHVDELTANLTADRLIERLERSGYVVMCKPELTPRRVDLGAAIDRAAKIRQEG